jgi:hypothetical protein
MINVKGHLTWKLVCGDIAEPIIRNKNEPPHHVYFDDRACYGFLISEQYTKQEMRLFWPSHHAKQAITLQAVQSLRYLKYSWNIRRQAVWVNSSSRLAVSIPRAQMSAHSCRSAGVCAFLLTK